MVLALMFTGVDVLHICNLFSLEWLVSLDCHPVHFEWAVVLIKSEIPLCSDSFVVASPHHLVTTGDPLQLGIPPEPLLSRTVGVPHILAELLVGRIHCCVLGVWACEAIIDSCWLRTRASGALPWVTVHCLSQTHYHPGWCCPHCHPWWSLYHNVLCSPRPAQPTIIRVSSTLNWTGGQLRRLSWGWLKLWLVTSAVSLPPVLGWTPLSDLGWAGGRLHPLLM